ncbi:hypothetical protein GCM10018793_06730 [Streptomyces sulfonofaciens]|uniref:Integral membrane protein n=1 Tax=Streptomyces sulfonofaciens TaxID=68272 RepID=A0A919FT26_9ACTN|nr:hypothetical protein [Streptomyces sulfonofaciens]GHH71489.1 hypothetical protein GCM10018793_06730 [Streptomyces sulfonofaciens]
MRRFRALAVSAVTAAAVGLAVPTAAAWNDPDNITVTPSVIARGGQLTVSVDAPECRTPGSTVESEAFPRTELQPVAGSNRVTATVRVFRNAARGSYDVTARCDGSTLTRRNAFTVIGGVQGGLGGSSKGVAGSDMAIGGGLVAAALLGGGLVLRHRRAESNA